MLLLALSLLLCNMSYAAAALANSKTTKGSYSLEPYTENDMKNSYKVEFAIESEWENHYNGKISIKNISNNDIENWKLSFISKDTIENIWSAKIETYDNDTYIVKHLDWNQNINAGQEISFGFTASYEHEADTPHDFFMSSVCKKVEATHTIDYKIISNWGTGLNGEIRVKNNSDKVTEDWRLMFESNLDIGFGLRKSTAKKETFILSKILVTMQT